MFVHSGAGLHGHEYSSSERRSSSRSSSPRATHQPHHRPIPLLRSALRPLSDIHDSHSANDGLLYSSFPQRRSFTEPSPSRFPSTTSGKELGVRFQEPNMELMELSVPTTPIEGDESAAESELSDITDSLSSPTRRKRRTRARRQTTRYMLAHPAPQRRTKQRMLVQLRPRLLLQLQQLDGHRPTPALDVLPSSTVAGSLLIPALTKKFPRIFRAKPELGPDDLLIVRSEDYTTRPATPSSSQADDRDLLAVVSPLPAHSDNDAEIVMDDGSIWTTAQIHNGSYEFTRVDGQGHKTTARWVQKPVPPPKQDPNSTDVSPTSSPQPRDNRWTFSIIDPSTRRHPIMGILTPQELEIYDTYSTLSASSGRYPPSRPMSSILANSNELASPLRSPKKETRTTEVVPEEFKNLMMASASWISLRMEGWPANANPKMRRAYTQYRAPSVCSTSDRHKSLPVVETTSPLPSAELGSPQWNRAAPVLETLASPPLASPNAAVPKRAMSTGAVFMRNRQLQTEHTVAALEESKAVPVEVRARDPVSERHGTGKTFPCRIKMRRLTQRLFHRRSCHTEC